MNIKSIIVPTLIIILALNACKTKPVTDGSGKGCGLSNPVWSAPVLLDDDSITLSVTSTESERQISITIHREGESSPLETVVLAPGLGKMSIDWRYDCDKYHSNSIREQPRVFFTAAYRGSSCSVKSASLKVGARIRVKNVDGRGEPEKNLKYELIGFSAAGEVVHRIKGITGASGMISHDDLIPCVRYNVKMFP